ncbi:MAG: SprT family zinc-dependent metalloprotease [Candidatus Nitrosopolaris sp.]
MTQQEGIMQYGSSTIAYSIVKSKRVKTSEIIVEANKVLVRTPLNKPVSEIHEIVKKKANWILKKQLEYKRLNPQIIKATFQHGSTLPYLGKNYPLKIINNYVGSEKIELAKGEFLIFMNGSKHSRKKIKLLYERWLSDAAQYFLDKKIKKYSKELKVEPRGIILKSLKDRWGSATKDGVINLSLNLLKAPTDIIDYMILHELCHLKIKEHSHRFWDLVHKFMPDYEDKIDWLKVNGNNLVST